MKTPLAPPAQEPDMPPVTLLPPTDAYDFESVAARLHDPELLETSVAVRVFRAPLLAVPVGGRRRGGRMDVSLVRVALAIRQALAGHPGFPDIRIRLASPRGRPHCWAVEWGERLPFRASDSDRIRFYGGSDRRIAEADSTTGRWLAP